MVSMKATERDTYPCIQKINSIVYRKAQRRQKRNYNDESNSWPEKDSASCWAVVYLMQY